MGTAFILRLWSSVVTLAMNHFKKWVNGLSSMSSVVEVGCVARSYKVTGFLVF